MSVAISSVEMAKPAAVTKNAWPMPTTAITIPAAAGPMMRIPFQIAPVYATALAIALRSIRRGSIAF